MQPWEKEKTTRQHKSFGKKVKLFAKGVGLGVVCCGVIYGSLLYSSAKYIIVGKESNDCA
jgi:hypothetical protein